MKTFRIIFYGCGIYFLVMGVALVVFPELLIRGVAANEMHPTVIGMLRGAGGSVIPYSLLYYLTARKPMERKWAFSVIATANILAIVLDIGSVIMGEYQFIYAMYDLPVESLSLAGIFMIRRHI